MNWTDERTGTIKWQIFAWMAGISSIAIISFTFLLFAPNQRLAIATCLVAIELFIYSFWWFNEALRARQFETTSIIHKSLSPQTAQQLTFSLQKEFPELKEEIRALEEKRFSMMVCSCGHPYQIEQMKLFTKGWMAHR